MVLYQVIPKKVWKNKVTNATASVYGSVPYVSETDKKDWEIITDGFSVRDNKRNVIFTPYALIGKNSEQDYMEWVDKQNQYF